MIGFLDFTWLPRVSVPIALALVATLGYLVGRWKRDEAAEFRTRSMRELRRAQTVARELESISLLVQKHLAKHQTSVSRFKHRVARLTDQGQDAAWRQLCLEAEEILKPTLQLATQIASAYDEIRQQSNRLMAFTDVRVDPLTGIPNRRALDEMLASQFAMKLRYGASFSLALFDIDHFKEINDQQGHLRGDQVLQDVARALDESVRETDMVARFGGEEFIVVMPATDLVGATIISDRIRETVKNALPVTLSAGVTESLDGDAADAMIARADAALYSAKSAGRNSVFRHDGEQIEPATTYVSTQPI
ncbi:MAG: GGDEF domain-containing protein [Pirellulaceae bacterium]|nr:GGDEF domain-containing protein [Pirellulaceae bacterium]